MFLNLRPTYLISFLTLERKKKIGTKSRLLQLPWRKILSSFISLILFVFNYFKSLETMKFLHCVWVDEWLLLFNLRVINFQSNFSVNVNNILGTIVLEKV